MTTPQTPQVNDADLELLSAYIDHQVTPEERSALDRRLEREPALRQALDELRATVDALRELAPIRPPRSFTIDPATVRPRNLILARWLQFGSALAAAALALTLTFDIANSPLVGSITGSQPAAAPAPSTLAYEATAEPAAGGAAAPMTAAEPTAAPEISAAQSAGETTAAPEAAPASGAEDAATSRTTDEASANQAPALPSGTDVAIAPPRSSSPDTTALEPPAEAPPPPSPVVSPIRVLQIGLGAVVVLLGAAAFVLSRRQS